ncbi:MAG: 4-alpha-glucanotransferase [Planctomycetia bacterium]|nr:4-alpha-glucanotransferase [Planctomycetia bacterium]
MSLMNRTSGILLPIFSLPGTKYTGALGRNARSFADFLACSGQNWWQLLPINPIDYVFSPYSSCSAFAGEPLYLDLEEFIDEGLLDPEDLANYLDDSDSENTGKVDYSAAQKARWPLQRKAFARFREKKGGEKYRSQLDSFREENRFWLPDFMLYQAISMKFRTPAWSNWPEEYRNYSLWIDSDKNFTDRVHQEKDILEYTEYSEFQQLVFEVQWQAFKQYCNERHIELLGDVPIYVGQASSDTWAHRDLFQINEKGHLYRVAGVPGDSFNPDGQRWNSPLYQWNQHEETGFQWWIDRMKQTLKRFDAVRLDHFIGFYNYYSFPGEAAGPEEPLEDGDPGYEKGWKAGPQHRLFDTLFSHFPRESFIAEDLGVMNSGVHNLRDHYSLPGMEVLQFSFDWNRTDDPTRNWRPNSVVCTGTHDTVPIIAWIAGLEKGGPHPAFGPLFTNVWKIIRNYQREEEKKDPDFQAQPELYREEVEGWRYSASNPEEEKDLLFGIPDRAIPIREDIHALKKALIRMVMNSAGNTALFPLQDILGLGAETRMNFPGRSGGNWSWRLKKSEINENIQNEVLQLTREANRSWC